eukprot:TRINITY_DN46463_c0_g1_i1.p1 TRINITY_DN46463_c0_g1~~TRINITY_DN46463_c0_g1_i1.p1  ORF type:complete len:364 (+),score=64.79 TRINITY_DN46463_c0_g1_i1:123-1094(+)
MVLMPVPNTTSLLWSSSNISYPGVKAPADNEVSQVQPLKEGTERIGASNKCDMMLIATVFTKIPNAHWDRTISADGTFSKTPFGLYSESRTGSETWRSAAAVHDSLMGLVTSVANAELDLTILYDELPQSILDMASSRIHFLKIDPDLHDSKKNSVHMARFFFIRDLVSAHPEWKSVFMIDAMDVSIGKNMCEDVDPKILYIGKDARGKTVSDEWMVKMYKQLGGEYHEWYDVFRKAYPDAAMLNIGVVGGAREVALEFLKYMTIHLADQATVEPWGSFVSDMSIGNFVVRHYFSNRFFCGEPLNSQFGQFENQRHDVWFIHK